MSLHNTTVFGYFLSLIVVAIVVSLIGGFLISLDWVKIIPILFILFTASFVYAMYDASKKRQQNSEKHTNMMHRLGVTVITRTLVANVKASGKTVQVLSTELNLPRWQIMEIMNGHYDNKQLPDHLPRSKSASTYAMNAAAPGTPTGPGSCVHLTKTTFDEVSAALGTGQMTQQEIAQKFNIPASVVSRVKKGKINVEKLAN